MRAFLLPVPVAGLVSCRPSAQAPAMLDQPDSLEARAWLFAGSSDTTRWLFAALLLAVDSGLAIRFEHETMRSAVSREPRAVSRSTSLLQPGFP